MELDAFLDLLTDAFLGAAVRRVEGVVTAEGAASCAYRTIAVRAVEAGVDAYFLHTASELAFEVRRVGVETSVVVPGKHCSYFSFIITSIAPTPNREIDAILLDVLS